ncbi:site-specific integrase [Williamsia phyllosphaerae]|uniref:Phage integrase n=1 Tax=Williamsia phyllosphaerae TaxID=885042 RepID=A0ABQ1V5I3_9NOCA|nr:site-specific integrase [Williamsia phyllosphaerae]GGF38771.1 putative phage integrase [Williamsia phyllosphaerae]
MAKRRAKGEGGIFQRANGLWVGTVELGYKDGKRQTKTITSMDYKTLVEKHRTLTRAIEDGLMPVTDKTTLDAWLTRWLDEIISREVKPGTLKTYRTVVTNQIVPHLGTKKLNKLQPADIRAMTVNIVQKDGKSTGTSLQAYRVLSKSLVDAMREGLIRDNPCDRVKPPRVVRADRGSHDLEQVKNAFAHLLECNDPMLSRWAMSWMTGARQAECLGLEWDRVSFDTDTIDISWSLQWLPLKDRYRRQPTELYPKELFAVDPGFDFRPIWRTACLVPPKTARSTRVVPMIPPLRAVMLARWEMAGQPTSGLVWTRDGGKPYRKIDDSNEWHAMLARAGVPDLTLHSARHTVATLLQAGGVEEQVRMALMGHSSVAAHRGYAHVDQALSRQALGTLDQLMG